MAKAIARPAVLSVDVPDVVKETIALKANRDRYQSLTSPELRKECSAIGVKWRNVYGKRHLSKAEMVAVLSC